MYNIVSLKVFLGKTERATRGWNGWVRGEEEGTASTRLYTRGEPGPLRGGEARPLPGHSL